MGSGYETREKDYDLRTVCIVCVFSLFSIYILKSKNISGACALKHILNVLYWKHAFSGM